MLTNLTTGTLFTRGCSPPRTYCTTNEFTKTENMDGEELFECDCGERKNGDCSAGTYSGLWQRENSCDGGECKRELGTGGLNCTGCAKEESKSVQYVGMIRLRFCNICNHA